MPCNQTNTRSTRSIITLHQCFSPQANECISALVAILILFPRDLDHLSHASRVNYLGLIPVTFGSPRETQFHASETDSLTCFTVHQRRNISGCSILERLLFSSSRAEANPCTHRVPLLERMLATHGFPQENQFHASEADSLVSSTVHQRRNISGASILKRSLFLQS